MAEVVSTEPSDCAVAYGELRLRVTELVRSADPAALDALAQATPEWRVRDILAHMSGVNTDIVNGNLNGVASDEWTDAQVATRREWPVDDNPLHHAPHTVNSLVGDWDHPYSREEAAFPSHNGRRGDRYFPPVRRIDGGYGDRNLVCSCPPVEELAE